MSTATLAGKPCMSVTVNLPSWGLWWADCQLDNEADLSGQVVLQLADLTLNGAIVSGGSWLGRSSYRIVGGAGGWCKPLKEKAYVNDAGVKIAKVLGDAAAEAGETIEGAPSGICGTAFARQKGPASLSLNLLASQSWRVDVDGVTRFGAPTGKTVDSSITRGKVDFAAGSIELMSDSIAALLPGCICEGITAVDVTHRLASKKLRTTIYGSAFGPTTKRLLAWSKLIEQMRPFERYRGVWEYRVVDQTGERYDLQPATSRYGLPDLQAVRVRYGLPGCTAKTASGSLVLVAFVNSDPSRPAIVGFDDPDSPGFLPTEIDIYNSAALPVARLGDTVQAGPFAGVITSGSTKVKVG